MQGYRMVFNNDCQYSVDMLSFSNLFKNLIQNNKKATQNYQIQATMTSGSFTVGAYRLCIPENIHTSPPTTTIFPQYSSNSCQVSELSFDKMLKLQLHLYSVARVS